MQPPKWFYIVLAVCASVVSFAALLASVEAARNPPDEPDHWELVQAGRWDKGVFNSTTGDECDIIPDSTTVRLKVGCLNLTKENP
jgi:hypothetical protein